jgi:hypothetical protein
MPTRRYGNRNDWKTVYSRIRRKPVREELVDLTTGENFVFDKNKTVRYRDFFILDEKRRAVPLFEIYPAAEYDEGLIEFFGNEDNAFATGSFSFTFSGNPFVVLTPEPAADNQHGLNVFGLEYDQSGLVIGVSSDFVGNIRYRAVYSAEGYPAFVTSPVSSSGFVVSAGSTSIVAADEYSAIYPELDFFQEYRSTIWGDAITFDNNVSLISEAEPSQVTGQITSEVTADVHFIAVGALNAVLWPPS